MARQEQVRQLSLFDGSKPFRLDKPIRLIELFAGIGTQHLAFNYLGIPVESHHICEWAVKSIQAYKDLHFPDDNTDYAGDMPKDEIVDFLFAKGISADYDKPMTREQIARLGVTALKTIYNNIKATHNLVSVTNVHGPDLGITDTDSYDYILTYSYPCQDLSLAGNGKGMTEGSNTRSSLLWEVKRILSEIYDSDGELPQVLLMENVPQCHGTKNVAEFNRWCNFLESIGYKNHWQDLNAKNYGYPEPIPQNRDRCFMVSILGDYIYEFPSPQPLRLRLKDLLEPRVDEKYYLSEEMIKAMILRNEHHEENGNGFRFEIRGGNDVGRSITTKAGSRLDDNFIGEDTEKVIQIANLSPRQDKRDNPNEFRVYDEKGLSPTLGTMDGGNRQPMVIDGYNQTIRKDTDTIGTITCNAGADLKRHGWGLIEPIAYDEQDQLLHDDGTVGTIQTDGSSAKHNNRVLEPLKVKEATTKGYDEAVEGDSINISYPESDTRRGRVGHGVAQTLQTEMPQGVVNGCRVRKLTPRECWRLMGIKDEDYDKVAKNQSDSSRYHLAGDAIVVAVLMAIINQMT